MATKEEIDEAVRKLQEQFNNPEFRKALGKLLEEDM